MIAPLNAKLVTLLADSLPLFFSRLCRIKYIFNASHVCTYSLYLSLRGEHCTFSSHKL